MIGIKGEGRIFDLTKTYHIPPLPSNFIAVLAFLFFSILDKKCMHVPIVLIGSYANGSLAWNFAISLDITTLWSIFPLGSTRTKCLSYKYMYVLKITELELFIVIVNLLFWLSKW